MYVYERDPYAETHQNGPGWLFWLLWVLAIVAAGLVGQTVDGTVESALVGDGDLTLDIFIAGLAVGGAATALTLGIAQGLLLLRYLRKRGFLDWLIATLIGRVGRLVLTSTLGVLVLNLLNASKPVYIARAPGREGPWGDLPAVTYWNPHQPVFNLITWLALLALVWGLSGSILGIAQWSVLRAQVYRAEWWIWANAGGAALAIVISASAVFNGQDPSGNGVLFDIVYGAVTGLVLVDLLRHPRPEATWRLALRPEHTLDDKTVTVLGSQLYEQGPAVRPDDRNSELNTPQGEHTR